MIIGGLFLALRGWKSLPGIIFIMGFLMTLGSVFCIFFATVLQNDKKKYAEVVVLFGALLLSILTGYTLSLC